ncbi:MAG: transcription factor [Benniella sp.]|nr:MAG: transcription factor [Benniella sp.]
MAPISDLNRLLLCPDCKLNPPNIVEVFRSGDLICGECGLVLEERIVDMRSEWRTFSDNVGDDPSRVGAAIDPLLGSFQLDTLISPTGDCDNTAMGLVKMHGIVTSSKDARKLVDAYRDISAMCDAIGLSKVITDTSKQLFKRILDENLFRGRLDLPVITACIYIACRQQNVPRTINEILALTHVSKKEFTKCFKLISGSFQEAKSTPMAAEDPMPRFCSSLCLSMDVQKTATSLALKAKDLRSLSGKTPATIAAACIYMASNLCNDTRSMFRISLDCGVTEVTIKKAYKRLYDERDELIDENLTKAQVDTLPSP